jgi:transcriptional regulator with XRE-family HTH domain
MGQRPKQLTPHESPQHYWGAELRTWRTERGLSLAELGHRIHLNSSYLGKIERGERPPPLEVARACDTALDAAGALVRLHNRIVTFGDQGDTWGRVHGASSGRHVANGADRIAQTEDEPAPLGYTGDEITVPARTPNGRIIFVSVSRRLFLQGVGTAAAAGALGMPGVGRAAAAPTNKPSLAPGVNPIAHFREMRRVLIDSDNLFGARRVVPAVQEQIAIMQQLRQGARGDDHRQLTHLQTQYAEFAGWLYQDLGDHEAAQYWTARALEWSHVAGDSQLTVYILARKSQLAGDMAIDPAETIQLAEAAINMARPRSRLAAVAATYAAHGYALDGDRDGCARAYDRAHQLLERMDDPQSQWGVWLDPPYIEVQRARSLAALGDYTASAAGFQAAIAALPAGYHRDHGVYLAREALAHAGAGEAEHAAELGLQALGIGVETSSGRILTELDQLNRMFAPQLSAPGVSEFRDAMASTVVQQV